MKLGYDIMTWAATQLAICYTVMPFLLLAVNYTIVYYRYVIPRFNQIILLLQLCVVLRSINLSMYSYMWRWAGTPLHTSINFQRGIIPKVLLDWELLIVEDIWVHVQETSFGVNFFCILAWCVIVLVAPLKTSYIVVTKGWTWSATIVR